VVDHWEEFVLRVDTTSVGLESVGNFDTARDWSVLVKISLHLVSTSKAVVVGSIVVFVVNSPAFVLASLVLWAWWPSAVLAFVHGTASGGFKVMGNVLLARGIWDTLFMGELINTTWVSTFA
jgi:hypothetical protein